MGVWWGKQDGGGVGVGVGVEVLMRLDVGVRIGGRVRMELRFPWVGMHLMCEALS